MCLCICVYVQHIVCRCLWRPEEGVRFPRSEVTSGCQLPDKGAGQQTQVLCKSSIVNLPLSYLTRLSVSGMSFSQTSFKDSPSTIPSSLTQVIPFLCVSCAKLQYSQLQYCLLSMLLPLFLVSSFYYLTCSMFYLFTYCLTFLP